MESSTSSSTGERPVEQDAQGSQDDAMRKLIARLSRPHRSGGVVIERASLLAEGHDFAAALRWIEAHGGQPESAIAATTGRGLHSARVTPSADRVPLRFVLPPGALR